MAAVFSPSTALPSSSSSSSFLESCLNFLSIHFSPVIVIGLLSFLSSFYLGLLTFGDAITFYLMLNVLKTFAPSLVDFSLIVSPVQPASPGESQESLQSRQEAEEFKFIVLLLSIRGLFNSVAMVRLAWKEARWDFLKWCAPVLTVSTCAGVFILDHFGESSWLHPLLGVMLGGSGFSCLFLRIRKQYCPEEKNVADDNKTNPQEESNKKNDEFLPQNLNSEMNLMEADRQPRQEENINVESTQEEQEEAEEMQRQNQSSTAFTTSFASRSYTKQQNYSSANTIVLPQETPNSPLSSPVIFSASSTKENNDGVVSPLPSPTSNSTTNHKKNTNSTISTSQGLFPSTFEKSPVLNSFFDESHQQQQSQKSLRQSLTPNATAATQQTPPSSSLTMKFSSPKLKQQQFNSSNLTTSRRKTSARLSAAPAPSSTSSVPQIPPPLLNNTNNEEDQLFALPPPEININDQSNENDKNHIIIPDTPPTAGSASAVGQVAMFPSTPSILPDSMMIGNTNGSKKNTPFISASTPKKNNENNQIVQEETVCNEEPSTTEEIETTTPSTNEQPQIQNESAAVSSSSTTDEDADARRKLNDPVYMYKAKCFIVASCIASGLVGGICNVAAIGLIVVVTALELPKSLARGILPLCFLWILVIRFMYTVLEGEFTMAAAWPENISMIGFGIAGTAAGNYVGKVVNNEQFLMSVVVMMIVGGLSLGEAPFWMVGSAFGIGTIWVGRTFFESKKQRGFISNSLSTIAHLGKKEERRKE